MDKEEFFMFIVAPMVVLTIVLLLVFGIAFLFTLMEKPACNNLQEISTLEYHWDIWNGCLVEYNGYWFKLEDFPYKELEIKIKEK